MTHVIDPRLLEWATPTQAKYLEAANEHGSGTKAAKALGVAKSAVNESLQRLKTHAAMKGYSPEHDLSTRLRPGKSSKAHRRTTTKTGSRRDSGSNPAHRKTPSLS